MTTKFKDLKLNNGLFAKFLDVDFWSRPHYSIEYKGNLHRVCCTECDGTYLHSLTPTNDPEGEPDSPLVKDFQPSAENFS